MPIVLGIIAVIVLLGGATLYFGVDSETSTSDSSNTEIARPEDTTESATETANTQEATDSETSTESETASYTADASYLTPARTSHDITVTLTLSTDGMVTAADVVYDNGDGYSNPHQERFDQAYKNEVVGQNISDINLARVGGASVTSRAFNEAVEEIQTEAAL